MGVWRFDGRLGTSLAEVDSGMNSGQGCRWDVGRISGEKAARFGNDVKEMQMSLKTCPCTC